MINTVISVVILAAAVGQPPMTPIAVRASNGVWIGVRNDASEPVEMCDFSASVQRWRRTGSEGRISGGVIPFCERPVGNVLVQPQQTYFIWLAAKTRAGGRWTFSVRAALIEPADGTIREVKFAWHEWAPVEVASTAQDASAWRAGRLGWHDGEWIVVNNVSHSPRAISVELRGAGRECSRVRGFHLVLPGESLVAARGSTPEPMVICEADAQTGKWLSRDGLQISPAGPK